MDKKQRKANQKLQQAQNFAENLRANQNLPLEEKALRTKVISPEKGTLVSYEHIINDEYVFTDSNHNIIIGKCWQAKTVISETTLTPQP